MAQRHREWARRRIAWVRQALGGVCQDCGAGASLELHCEKPQGHKHHAMGRPERAVFFMRQLRQGNLRLLCQACHRRRHQVKHGPAHTRMGSVIDLPPY